MTIKSTRTINYFICVFLFCLTPFSFANPVIRIDNKNLLTEAQVNWEFYINQQTTPSYLMSYIDSEGYSTAEQFQKLLSAKVISNTSEYKIDKNFLSAFKQLKILTTEQLDILITAFKSPIYLASPSSQLLTTLYRSIDYGSKNHETLFNNIVWGYETSSLLWSLGNFVGYYALKSKPHIQAFLDSTYANGGFPALYNPPHSYFFSELMSGGEDIGDELGHAVLAAFSYDCGSEELRNHVGFLENCKVDKHSGYPDLKSLKHDEHYTLEAKATSGVSKMHLTPVPGYYTNTNDTQLSKEEYSRQSLDHVVKKVIQDKTEGAIFYVLYRGLDKYQLFTIGVYQGFLSLTYVIDDHAPTPILNYLIPLKGMNVDQIIHGIHSMLHQGKSSHDMVPDLQGVWMISSQQK